MLTVLLILVPALAAAAAFVLPSRRWRSWGVPCGGASHTALTLFAVGRPFTPTMRIG